MKVKTTELRKILFSVSNQNLTVEKLRRILFDCDHEEIDLNELERITSEI